MLKRIFLVSVVMAVSAVAETKATVVNYNSEWISWVKRMNFFPIPPTLTPQAQVFCYSTDPDVVAVRITLKVDKRTIVRVYPVDSCGGIIEGEFPMIESSTVEPLVSRGALQADVQQRP